MADVTGLVLGTVALASLFSTCIDLFNYFELGKNYAYDYRLACTKVALLKARLFTWGRTLRIESPGHELLALRQRWEEEQEVIGRSLFGIKDIFENASLLQEKYQLTPSQSRSFSAVTQGQAKGIHPQTGRDPVSKVGSGTWSFLKKRTVWAIRDKQRFDTLIGDLSFLIDNLEKVTERVAMQKADNRTPVSAAEPQALKDDSQLAVIHRRWSNARYHERIPSQESKPSYESIPPYEPVRPPQNPGKQHGRPGLNVNELALKMTGHVYDGDQHADGGAMVVGSVGKSDKRRNMYTGNQKVTNQGLMVVGNASTKAAAALNQPRRKAKKPEIESSPSEESDSESVSESSDGQVEQRKSRALRLTKT